MLNDMSLAKTWKPSTLQQTLTETEVWDNHKMKQSPKSKVLHVTHLKQPPVLPALTISQNTLEACHALKVIRDGE